MMLNWILRKYDMRYSSGLVVRVWRQYDPPKRRYPTTSLHFSKTRN